MVMDQYRYHVRSISFPSISHPLTARVEEELSKLRGLIACPSSSLLQDGLCGLISLYESVEDLLQLPHTQQVLLHHRDEKSVDKVLEGSVRLLDVSGTTRDVLLQMKELVQETQLSLRRRREDFNFKNDVESYMRSRKKANKVINKSLNGLRKLCSKQSAALLDKDQSLVAVISVLTEVEAMTSFVLESLFSSLSGVATLRKPGGWPLVAKLMHSKRIMSEEQLVIGNEIVKADSAVFGLMSRKLCADDQVANVQKQLEALESSIRSLEDRLECLFRRLIKTRVSLLNILSI